MLQANEIEKSPLFDGVDPRTLRTITASLVAESWPKGCQIMGPADSTESFRLVSQGRVKVVRSNSGSGREVTLWLLGPGDGFDIVSLLDGRPHGVTVWALDEVRTLGAPMGSWRDWLDRFRPLRLAAHRYVAARLRDVSELATDLALQDTGTRLAHLLLRHFDSQGENLLRDLPQRELATMIGSVRIVVSRALAQLRRQGVIELHNGAVRAADLKRLMDRARSELARGGTRAQERGIRKG